MLKYITECCKFIFNMVHPPHWCAVLFFFSIFIQVVILGFWRIEREICYLFPQLSHGIIWLPVLSQALVHTLLIFKIIEVRCQLCYISAKSQTLRKSPAVAHPFVCFQNDHTMKLRDNFLPAGNTQDLCCKSIAYEMQLQQHLHTMCCQGKTHYCLSFNLYVIVFHS